MVKTTIPMSNKELGEARRVRIPESIIGKMAMGYVLTDRERDVVKSKGKVYVEAYRKDGKWIQSQLRNLPSGSSKSSDRKIRVMTGYDWKLEKGQSLDDFLDDFYEGAVAGEIERIRITDKETGEVLLEDEY